MKLYLIFHDWIFNVYSESSHSNK